MEINCSYCKECDTLFDNKFIDVEGLCPECDGTLIFMVARPGVSRPSQQDFTAEQHEKIAAELLRKYSK